MPEMKKPERLKFKITEVKVRLAEKKINGLVGWAWCIIDNWLLLNNIKVRCTRKGDIQLIYPAQGIKHSPKFYFYFRPLDQRATETLKEAVLAELKAMGVDLNDYVSS